MKLCCAKWVRRAHGVGVAVLYAQVNVAHGAVEGAGAGVAGLYAFFHHVPGEPEHILRLALVTGHFFLEARGVLGQDDFRALLAVADEAHGAGDVDGLADFVLAFGDEQDAEVLFLLHLVDGRLKGVGHVHLAVGLDAVVLGREVERLGVVRPLLIDGVQLHGVKPAAHCAE